MEKDVKGVILQLRGET